MSELPANARGIAIEVEAFRGSIVEVDLHLHEIEDGNDIELFPGLPDTQDDDNNSHLRSSVIGAPFGVKHDRGNAEEGEVDHKSLYYNETRNQDEMDIDLFDPVWQPDRPFPGEIPEEISEYLGSPEYPRSVYPQFLGSSRTIFWLCGFDMMVKIIDGPAYVLKDEIVLCPEGCCPGMFLIKRYASEGKVPLPILDKFEGYPASEDYFEWRRKPERRRPLQNKVQYRRVFLGVIKRVSISGVPWLLSSMLKIEIVSVGKGRKALS